MDILLIASNLALLTYVIGIITLALPIPYRALKKWGTAFIIDSLASMLILSIYNILLGLGDYILSILGHSWKEFIQWLVMRTGSLLGVFIALTYIASLVRGLTVPLILQPFNIVLTFISLALSAIKIIYLLALTVYTLRDKLMALGILLYSIPFRIGKGVGAFIIAASIVMYVGFPLLPAFINYLTPNPVSVINKDVLIKEIKIHITDSFSKPIPYPVLLLYSVDDTAKPKAIVLGNAEGVVMLGDGRDIIPVNKTLIVKVELMGYIIMPQPSIISTSKLEGQLWLKLPGVVYSNGLMILATNANLRKVKDTGDFVELNIEAPNTSTLRLIKYSYVNIDYLIINSEEINCSWSNTTWRGLGLNECELKLGPGNNDAIIVFQKIYAPSKPLVNEKRLISLRDLSTIIYAYIMLGSTYIYTLVFLPSVYVALLTSMSLALARVFGGGVKIKLI